MQTNEEIHGGAESVCQHCLKQIEKKEEAFYCPACGTVYHDNCWHAGHGCAVISCSQRNILLNPLYSSAVPVRELLVHVEYLMNLKKFSEALNECTRILGAEKDNLEAKVLYNRASSLLNIRMKIYESADEAFRKKEYKASAMFYRDYLKYCDEEESEFINSRIKYIGELLPAAARKKKILNGVYAVIAAIILLSAGFLAYTHIYLREDFEFADIERDDDAKNVRVIESQIGRYERFLIKYSDGKLKDRASEKISGLSEILIKAIYKDDWRVALEYLKKINSKENPKTYNDLFRLVYSAAWSEFAEIKKEASRYDGQKKYAEARNQIEKGIALIDNFRDTELDRQRQQLLDSKNLLSKKIGFVVKAKDIDREIKEKTEELKKIEPQLSVSDIIIIEGRVVKKITGGVVVKSYGDRKLYAVNSARVLYEAGEEISVTGYRKGKTEVKDDAGNTMILPAINLLPDRVSALESDKNSILQRLNYLKGQREKIDSVLKAGI